jgi:RecA/RadA recombinase
MTAIRYADENGKLYLRDSDDYLPEEKKYPLYRDKNGVIHYDAEGFPILLPDFTEEEKELQFRKAEMRFCKECTGEDYVLGPSASAKFEGWFPLGEVSLIAGPSGAGKTTWALQMLEAQAKGETFLGHPTFELPYLVLMKDRSEKALHRTLRRLEVDKSTLPLRKLPGLGDGRVKEHPANIIQELYKAEHFLHKPRVIFMEGLDIWIPDNHKMETVSDVLTGLQEVAERYNFALIATLGAPKKSKKDQYESPRDSIYGSSVFARMTETIVKVSEDYETGARSVMVMPRNEKAEKFNTVMRNGRLVETIPVRIDMEPAQTQEQAFAEWLTPESTWEQAEERFGISRATFFRWSKRSLTNVGETSLIGKDETADYIDG